MALWGSQVRSLSAPPYKGKKQSGAIIPPPWILSAEDSGSAMSPDKRFRAILLIGGLSVFVVAATLTVLNWDSFLDWLIPPGSGK